MNMDFESWSEFSEPEAKSTDIKQMIKLSLQSKSIKKDKKIQQSNLMKSEIKKFSSQTVPKAVTEYEKVSGNSKTSE